MALPTPNTGTIPRTITPVELPEACVTNERSLSAIEALHVRERELSLIFNNVSDVVFYVAAEAKGQFRFAAVNPAFLAVTGLKREQVVGKLVQEVIPAPSLAIVLDS